MSVQILGIDPGLANMGLAVVQLHPTNAMKRMSIAKTEKGLGIFNVSTKKSDRKQKVRATDDNFRRGKEVLKALLDVFILFSDIQMIAAEGMSFPRNSSNAQKLGIAWGIIVSVSEMQDVPVVQASPQDIKKAVCGRKDASKEAVQTALSGKYNVPLDHFNKTEREHPFDALGAVEACMDSEVARVVMRLANERAS